MELEELNHAIVEFYEKLSSWEHDVVREKGLTLPQIHALEILGIHESMRMKELASWMGTLTVLIDRLESKDYVRRCPHKTDRRSIIIELTDTGRQMFMEHDKLHMQLTETMVAGISQEDRECLCRCLETMNKAF